MQCSRLSTCRFDRAHKRLTVQKSPFLFREQKTSVFGSFYALFGICESVCENSCFNEHAISLGILELIKQKLTYNKTCKHTYK